MPFLIAISKESDILKTSWMGSVAFDMDANCPRPFGSILGDIGLCKTYFEEGRAIPYGELLDRYEKTNS
jgi:hypothetical protein